VPFINTDLLFFSESTRHPLRNNLHSGLCLQTIAERERLEQEEQEAELREKQRKEERKVWCFFMLCL
jgi:hypothetical protein